MLFLFDYAKMTFGQSRDPRLTQKYEIFFLSLDFAVKHDVFEAFWATKIRGYWNDSC